MVLSFSFVFLLSACLRLSRSFYIADSNPILAFDSQVREGHFYTENHKHGMYLQITRDGRVSGSAVQTPYSLLELKAVRPGHVVIKGRMSSLFLCGDSEGSLRGQRQYAAVDCTFRELLLADGYTSFLSSSYDFPVSLASRRSRDGFNLPFARFLPIRSAPIVDGESEQTDAERNFHLDSDDLFGMGQISVVSPQFFD